MGFESHILDLKLLVINKIKNFIYQEKVFLLLANRVKLSLLASNRNVTYLRYLEMSPFDLTKEDIG